MTVNLAHAQVIVGALTKAAKVGDTCPSNHDLGRLIGRKRDYVGRVLDYLQGAGIIDMRRRSHVRAVRIVPTNEKTAGYDRLGEPRLSSERRGRVIRMRQIPEESLPARVTRDPCPWCNTRMDAPEEFCCVRGRALRRLCA